MREDVRNRSVTTLPLLEQVPASANEYFKEPTIHSQGPEPNIFLRERERAIFVEPVYNTFELALGREMFNRVI